MRIAAWVSAFCRVTWRANAPGCPVPYPYLQSQRDCVTQPRVARNELLWVKVTDNSQPQRGCGLVLFLSSSATTLSGLDPRWRAFSQGSSFLATLGFIAESLWDSAAAKCIKLAGVCLWIACPLCALGQIERFAPGGSGDDKVFLLGEHPKEHPAHSRVLICEEDSLFHLDKKIPCGWSRA